jgi:FtsP/CotA-like multicopper oxidase with cupredoxin domain
MQVPAGQVERWRVINASRTRCVRLSLGDHPFRVLATDGGLVAAPYPARTLLMAPGDRYDLAVGPLGPDRTLAREELLGATTGRPSRRRLAVLVSGSTAGATHADLAGFARDIPALVHPDAAPHRVLRPGQESAGPGSEALRPGRLQVWELLNDTGTDQPFHLHGSFFQVVAVDGSPPPYRSWEDTLAVPARGRVRIAWVPDGRPAWWRYQLRGSGPPEPRRHDRTTPHALSDH